MTFPLTVMLGDEAKFYLQRDGWQPELFNALVGASGGAKLLGIAHLDKFLFSEFLARSPHPMELYGSSIGSWRHAALASPDPSQALEQLQNRYLSQTWDRNDKRSREEIVDGLCNWVLDGFLTDETIEHIVHHPRFRTHIMTARGIGLNGRANDWLLALGLVTSAATNLLHRKMLELGFQRIVFSSGPSAAFNFRDFNTLHVPLSGSLLRSALLASGSIPFLMGGITLHQETPPGRYWDGGIIDYHFDFKNQTGPGLVLYPHFNQHIIPGWFDKNLPWRRQSTEVLSRTVVIAPSENYLAQLPGGKIPDRKDFNRYDNNERLEIWNAAVERSQLLAEAFSEMISHHNPMAFVAN